MPHRRKPTLSLIFTASILWAVMAVVATASDFTIYSVRPGDTVTSIAQKYRIEPVIIIVHNNLKEPYRLSVGQRLKIPTNSRQSVSTTISKPRQSSAPSTRRAPVRSTPPKPAPARSSLPSSSSQSTPDTYTVKNGDSLAAIARKFGLTIEHLAAINHLSDPSSIYPGQTLALKGSATPSRYDAPVEKIPKGGGESRSSSSSYSGPRNYAWPVQGRIIKEFSPSGYIKCWGIMIAAAEGTTVKAARSGQVTFSGSSIPGYGNMIMIDHGDNYYSVYAHNKSNVVKVNDRVSQGQKIALVGKRPQDPEHNLYFEIRNGKGEAVDPQRYLTN